MPRQFYLSIANLNPLLVATIENASNSPGGTMFMYNVDPNKVNWNAVWELTPEGLLLNAADPSLALAVNLGSSYNGSGYSVVTATPDPNKSEQRWTLSPTNPLPGQACQIFSQYFQGNSMALNAAGGATSGAGLIVWPDGGEGPNGQWALQPVILAEALITLETALSPYANVEATSASTPYIPFVLGINGSTPSEGTTIQVQPLEPSALTQWWILDWAGLLVSAQNPAYAVTISGTSGHDYNLSLTNDGGSLWKFDGRGQLYTEYDGTKVYLNVQGGSLNNNGNTDVIGFSEQGYGINQVWLPRRVQTGAQGLYFVIGSAWTDTQDHIAVPYILTPVANGNVYAAPPLADGTPLLSQLWRMTTDGKVANALNPKLLLTLDLSGAEPAVLVRPVDGDTPRVHQQWIWYGGHQIDDPKDESRKVTVAALVSPGPTNYVIEVGQRPGSGDGPGIIQITAEEMSQSGPLPGQLWFVAPHLPAFDQPINIRSGLGDGKSQYFLSIPTENLASGTQATLISGDTKGPGAAWQFTTDGQIVSSLNPALALSAATDGQGVCASTLQPGSPRFQLWMPTPDGLIISRMNGQALTASVGNDGSGSVSLAAPPGSGSIPASQRWHCTTGLELQTVLAQPRLPWPTPDEPSDRALAGSIYTYINQQLGLPNSTTLGLRTQYVNLAAPLQSYQLRISTMACPSQFSGSTFSNGSNAWASVIAQLDTEMTAVLAVQALFQQVQDLHLALTEDQSESLSALANAMNLAEDTKLQMPTKRSHAWIWQIVSGVLYTSINFAGAMIGDPEAGSQSERLVKGIKNVVIPTFANLLNTGINVAQAYTEGGSSGSAVNAAIQAIEKNNLTVLTLQQALIEAFQQVGEALGAFETEILTDWAKVRAVYEMTKSYGEPGSLFWPATTTPTLLKGLMPGYQMNVLQTLIVNGGTFSGINRRIESTQLDAPSLPSGLQSDSTSFVDYNADGTYMVYELDLGGASQSFATNILNVLWDLGAVPFQFFHRQAGWSGFSQSQVSSNSLGAPYVICFFENGTASTVTIDIYCSEGQPNGSYDNDSQTIEVGPYGNAVFGAMQNGKVGHPVHGTVTISANGTTIATGSFDCDGTSHDWSTSTEETKGYVVTSNSFGLMDDVIQWDFEVYELSQP
ncbi:hypothetical protein [Inquilinus sp.]|jgi:hypothetical protein|uniref:hypothetical protein n=1 Tax=Inquilinus sp. TaxID=1932117 RepID=UPI003782FFB1